MNTKTRNILIVFLIVAALCRIAFATFVVGWSADIRGDETDYHRIATSLSQGDGFCIDGTPATRRPPAYPAVLSALYKVTGPRENAGRVLQIVLGTLLVYLVFLVTNRYFDERTGLVAAALTALNPFLIMISAYLLTENLYIIGLLLVLFFFPGPRHFNGPLRKTSLAAVVLALAALTRPTGIPLGIWILATGLLFGAGSVWRRSPRALVAAVIFCLVLLPWCIRNYNVVGGWVGLTTHGGMTFYQGNNQKVVDIPQYRGGVAPLHSLPHAAEIDGMNTLQRERFAWEKGKEFLRNNRPLIPKIMWWKFARFWRLKSDAGMSGVKSGWWWDNKSFLGKLASNVDVGFVYAIIVFPLFIAGIVLTWRRWREMFFLYGVVVAHTVVALVFFGSIRGRLPVEPVIAMFAAVAVSRLYTRLRPGS